jgi:hypothetical protein
MKTDGIFDFRVIEVPAKHNRPINLIFQGDIHYNSHNFARTRFEFDREEISSLIKKEQTYLINTGDTFEAMSTSERYAFQVAPFHESNKNRWEKEYAREIDCFLKEAPYLKNHTLACFGGNHYFKFLDGTTSDQILANKIGAAYIGCAGYIVLVLKLDDKHMHAIKIFVHHGRSSGKRAGSGFMALEDAAGYFVDADILVMGHDHKAGAMELPALKCSRGMGDKYKIIETQRIIGRSGSYLASYEKGVPSYAVDSMMRPSTLGYLHVILIPRRTEEGSRGKRVDRRWVQMKAVV